MNNSSDKPHYHRAVMLPWIFQKLHQTDFSGLCLVGSFMVAAWFNLKTRCFDFYLMQHRRLTHVDRIPSIEQDLAGVKEDVAGVKTDVAGVKKDVADVKQDISKITDILSRPWWNQWL